MMIAYLVWYLAGLFSGVVWTLSVGAALGYSHASTITVLLIGIVLGLMASWMIRGIISRI